MKLEYELIRSWLNRDGCVTSTSEIIEWIDKLNRTIYVDIKKIDFPTYKSQDSWILDRNTGFVRHKKNCFFEILGIQVYQEDKIIHEQPLINQEEIGYLGIICKMINGYLHFLMQAKIEPGNINCVQISPTLQATKSNFTMKHGGKAPAYLNYFLPNSNHFLLVDQIQSEQSSRFLKKRNRNIIIIVNDDVSIDENHRWMTLGQIKELLKIDNLVNMDTRTVLSGLPFTDSYNISSHKGFPHVHNQKLLNSMFSEVSPYSLTKIYSRINDYKMFSNRRNTIVSLDNLNNWEIVKNGIISKSQFCFKIIYCDISIQGREVEHWRQPMVEANGVAIFGLFVTVYENKYLFLISLRNEIGCFDGIELGATVQLESTYNTDELNDIENLFLSKIKKKDGIIVDRMLSEEGGRFFHEQNRNVIIEVDYDEIKILPDTYFWLTFSTLNNLVRINNTLNIQLRNLITLLDL